MREPFGRLLGRGERLVAAGEVELARTTGPLAMPLELATLFSPVLSVILAARLDGLALKALGLIGPPLLLFLLARYALRGWRRPREWIGVTDRRVLRWWRQGLLGGPRIQDVSVAGLAGVSLDQDDWRRAHAVHALILHLANERTRDLGSVHNGEALRDAILTLVAAAPTAPAPARPIAASPPPLPGDYRPS